MDRKGINALITLYPLDMIIKPDTAPWTSQYDERSAQINYALVRYFKPKTVLEFGTKGGRCTRDILRALLDNGGKFTFRAYEKEGIARHGAQENLNKQFGKDAIKVGGDVLKAKDIPDDIDYLFVDNSHDGPTTKWVFNKLLKKVKPGGLVHFHDIQVKGDYEFQHNAWEEMHYMEKLIKKNKFPLEKYYWTYEEGNNGSSTWWIHVPRRILKL